MKKSAIRIAIAAAAALTAMAAAAEIPVGYYSAINGKKDAELKTAIYNLVKNFTLISSYNDLPRYFQHTDVYPGTNRWWDMYSNVPLYAPSFSGLNREHSFPKSWWGGNTDVSAYVDLNHLYPSEMAANMAKSNYPLGMVDTNYKIDFDNGVTRVGYPVAGQGGGAKYVFEPADEYKGDFARTYFYMVTCYQNLTWRYSYMVNQNTYPTLNAWSIKLLLDWHRRDPVSEKEVLRNDVVYSYQNNRNPFIDYPELAEYLWGTMQGEYFKPGDVGTTPAGEPNLITPVQGMSLDFGEVAIGSSVTRSLLFHGENLTGWLDLVVSLANKNMFKISTNSINTSVVNSTEGFWLDVTYTPTALGDHTAKLIVSEGGIVGSRGIVLKGTCSPVPTLTACTTEPATNITPDSYLANWTSAAGETVDYYLVTRRSYVGGDVMEEKLEAETNSLEITGFDLSEYETYSVQSVRLGYLSPMSDVQFVYHAGVTGVEREQPLVVYAIPGGLRFICSAPQTGARIYDISGQEVLTLDSVSQNTDVELTAGVYLIVTDQHRKPIKVAVR